MNNGLPDKSVQLLIADPPYFEVKGEFDFIWKTFDEYLQQVEIWAKECKRLLADNGTLFWYGDRKNIAYSQVILDRYFNFENHIYWQKAEKCQMEMFDTLRSFYCRGYERILFYSNETSNEDIESKEHYKPIIEKLKTHFEKFERNFIENLFAKEGRYTSDLSARVHAGYKCGWANGKRFDLMDEVLFNYLNEFVNFPFNYFELKTEYDCLKNKVIENRRVFNNFKRLSDHWLFTNDGSVSKYDHSTIKPEEMTRVIILTCSRPKDLVFIPFAGSGTEVAMALKEGRNAIGFDTELKYVEMGNKRTELITMQPNLFH